MNKIKRNEIHLWYQDLEEVRNHSLTRAGMDLLNLDEQEKFKSFSVASKKVEYWATRVLVRTVLARYLPIPFDDIKFVENSHGRPEVSEAQLTTPLRFNISHSNGLLVCALALDCEIGIDIEDTKEIEDMTHIAQRHFSESEFVDLKKCNFVEQNKRFYEYWTLKEAYIKARGQGLAIPLQDFAFEFSPTGTISFSADPSLDDNPLAWHFSLHRPLERYQMALAIRKKTNSGLKIVERWNLLSAPLQPSLRASSD